LSHGTVLQIEGRGNGIKTNVVNNVDIAKALERPPECEQLQPQRNWPAAAAKAVAAASSEAEAANHTHDDD
jgi:hypothetical protein